MLELLVVMVIAGIMLGVVSLKAMPSEQQALQGEAQRIALLFQLARDEAIVRNRPIAFESQAGSYRFMMRDADRWVALESDSLLRERAYQRTPMLLTLMPANLGALNPLRIVFGREPVYKPFVLDMRLGDASALIRADGIGHFTVE